MIMRPLATAPRVLAVVACACLSLKSAHASIIINGYNFIEAEASVFGFPGSTDTQSFAGTATIPMHTSLEAVAGVAYSRHVIDFAAMGGQTRLSFGSDQQRGVAVTNRVDAFSFTATANEPFALSGFYNGGGGSIVTQQVHLIEEGTGTLFQQISQSSDSGSFTIGVPDGNLINSMVGSPTGNLVAGRSYTLYYSVSMSSIGPPPTASAIGNLTLAIGDSNPSDYLLTVVYQTPEVTGPLIDGFDPLPSTLTAVFLLTDVLPFQSTIGLDQVGSFQMDLPGGGPTAGDLDHFQLSLDNSGIPQGLTWGVQGFSNGLLAPIEILNNNFTLDISGTDPDTDEAFRYFWSESTNTFAPVPEPSGLALASIAGIVAALVPLRRRGTGRAGT